MKNLSLTALAGLAILSLAGVANADTYGPFTSATVGPFNTDFGLGGGAHPVANLTLPTFDTTLGTLTGISFTVGGGVTTTFTVSDASGNSNPVTLTSSANISLYAPPPPPGPATLIVFTIPANSINTILTPFGSFGPQAVVANGSNTVASYGGSFLPFLTVGPGSIVLPVSANGQSSASDQNGNLNASVRTTATAFGSVTYTYTPVTTGVPEPGSVAMLIAGGVSGAGFFLRRRRK